MENNLSATANKDFSIGEAFRFGWDVTRANLGFLIGFMIVAGVLQYIPNYILKKAAGQQPLYTIVYLFSLAVNAMVGIGFVKTGLRLVNHEKGQFSDLYDHWSLFWGFLGMSLLSGLAIMGGFLLLIIPGIILSIRLSLAPYFVVDKNAGPLESLKKSFTVTKGLTWKLFFFGLVWMLINLAGVLCLFIGVLVTFPVTLIASVYVYKKLTSSSDIEAVPLNISSGVRKH